MRVWRRRVEAWLSGLRTWQFVLIWDGSVVAGCMLGALPRRVGWGHPFNPSALVGTATGSLLAATVFAFVARRMQDELSAAPHLPPTALSDLARFRSGAVARSRSAAGALS